MSDHDRRYRVHVEYARGPGRGGRGRGAAFGSGRYGDRGGSSRSSYHSSSRGGDRAGMSYSEKYGPPRNTEYRCIVENLSSRVSWQVT